MRTLPEMTSIGREKLTRKAASMSRTYDAMKPTMKAGYDSTPFGDTRKANYRTGIDAAKHRVDPEKWARVWSAKIML